MAKVRLETPLTREAVIQLKAGDEVLLNGTIYVARDAAHKRLLELLAQHRDFPVDLKK